MRRGIHDDGRPRLLAAVAATLAVITACSGGGSAMNLSSPTTTASVHASIASTAVRKDPFAVGRRLIVFVDKSRSTPANGTYPAQSSRTLATIVEYPASGPPDASREISGARPRPGKYPVIVFVHGFGAHADNPYLHPWAAAGFIAVSPTFPLTNADAPGGPSRGDVTNEPADVSFLITQLAHLPTRHADLRAVTDTSSIGLMGQSMGAAIALSVGYNKQYKDPRIGAVVTSANSCLTPGCPFNSTRVPLLVIHGTADPVAPYKVDVNNFVHAPTPKIFLTLIGAKHIQYGDPWDPIAAQVTIDFLRHYLQHDVSAITQLKKDGLVTGKTSLLIFP